MKKKRYVKKCEICEKVFFSRSKARMYCSKECRAKANQIKQDEKGQLCWNCKNACGKCSWSKTFVPIEGWDATPTIINEDEGIIKSFQIHSCPQFIRG